MIKKTRGRWLAATLTATAAFTSACTSVDPTDLPGTYRNEETGGEVHLESDGTFTATGITADETTGNGNTDVLDFSGTWEFTERESSSNFIYLTVDEGHGNIGGIQLYPDGQDELEFRADPDGPPSLELTRDGAG